MTQPVVTPNTPVVIPDTAGGFVRAAKKAQYAREETMTVSTKNKTTLTPGDVDRAKKAYNLDNFLKDKQPVSNAPPTPPAPKIPSTTEVLSGANPNAARAQTKLTELTNNAGKAAKGAGDAAGKAAKGAGDAAGRVLKPVGDAAGRVLKPVGDAVKAIGGKIPAPIKKLGGSAARIGGAVSGIVTGVVSGLNDQKLADGIEEVARQQELDSNLINNQLQGIRKALKNPPKPVNGGPNVTNNNTTNNNTTNNTNVTENNVTNNTTNITNNITNNPAPVGGPQRPREPFTPKPIAAPNLDGDTKPINDAGKGIKPLETPKDKPLTPSPNPGENKPGGVNLATPINTTVNTINTTTKNVEKIVQDLQKELDKKITEIQKKLDDNQKKLDDNHKVTTENINKIQPAIDKASKIIQDKQDNIHTQLNNFLSGDILPRIRENIEYNLGQLQTSLETTINGKITEISTILQGIQTEINTNLGIVQGNINAQFKDLDANMIMGLAAIPTLVTAALLPKINGNDKTIINHTTNLTKGISSEIRNLGENLTSLTSETGRAVGKHKCSGKKKKKLDDTTKVMIPDPNKPRECPLPGNNWQRKTPEIEIKWDDDSEALEYCVRALARLENVLPISQFKYSELDRGLIFPNAKGNDKPTDLAHLLTYFYMAQDNVIGSPRKFKIADANSMVKGSQEMHVEPANLFALMEDTYIKALDAANDVDLATATASRAMLMCANIMKIVAEIHDAVNAIIDDLDFKTTEEMGKLKLPCDPYAGKGSFMGNSGFSFKPDKRFESTDEKDIESLTADMLSPSEVPFKRVKKNMLSPGSMRDDIRNLSRFAAASAASVAIPIDDIDKHIELATQKEELNSALIQGAVYKVMAELGLTPVKDSRKPPDETKTT